jgi:hypothetical protein
MSSVERIDPGAMPIIRHTRRSPELLGWVVDVRAVRAAGDGVLAIAECS